MQVTSEPTIKLIVKTGNKVALLLAASIVAFGIMLIMYLNYSEDQESFDSSLKSKVTTYSSDMATTLSLNNPDGLAHIAKHIGSELPVKCLVLKTKNDLFYAKGSTSDCGNVDLITNKIQAAAGGIEIGEFYYIQDHSSAIKRAVINALVLFPLLMLAIMITWLPFIRNVRRFLTKPLTALTENISGNTQSLNIDYGCFEINLLQKTINEAQSINNKNIKLSLISAISAQVSHDIRSPLGALEMTAGNTSHLPEDQKMVIRNAINRIREIANSLLREHRAVDIEEVSTPQDLLYAKQSIYTNISELVDYIVKEKKAEWSKTSNALIELEIRKDVTRLFSSVAPQELKRVLSNLINNSIEAFKNKSGKVTITLGSVTADPSKLEIKISDNGAGIPPEILPKLFQKGATFGKSEGNGLGLYHAKNTIEAMNGTLTLTSTFGKGATVTILLPKVEMLGGAETEIKASTETAIEVNSFSQILIVDDDQLIHEAWKMMLKDFSGIEISHFYSPREFMTYMRTNFGDQEHSIFLIDYEYREPGMNGIELIRSLGMQNQSYLVTGRAGDSQVVEECGKIGIKLVMKSDLANIKIKIKK